jgi:membrane-associated phospholipid phosphatase
MELDPHLLEQWARWAGGHALPVFCVMLAMVLAMTCTCWWMVRRYSDPEFRFAQLPVRGLILRVGVGMTVILPCSLVFTTLAGELGAGETLSRLDRSFTDALRISVSAPVVQTFAVLTHLGDTATLTGLCVGVAIALVALGRWWLMLGWVAAVAGNGMLNTALKKIFARVRPFELGGMTLEDGFSFPSGHSSGAVVAYGMLAYLALRLLPFRWHLPALMLAMTLAFTVGSSRLFLRVHFASDVIAGFASGAAWLALCVTAIEFLRWLRQRRG